MRPEDEATIRAVMLARPFACGSKPEHVLRVIDLWNEGHSVQHITEILGVGDPTLVSRPLASVRMRCPAIEVRRVGSRMQAPEHPSWWTPERQAKAQALWLEDLKPAERSAIGSGPTSTPSWRRSRPGAGSRSA